MSASLAPMLRPAFDPRAIRDEFPILSKTVYGKPLVYLDNAASTQKPKAVIETMRFVMEEEYANVHRGLHYMSNAATARFEAARETARRFLNARDVREIVFTSGATDALNLVASSYGRSFEAGDEIILSDLEHHSNIVPWDYLRRDKGVVIKWAPITDEGELDLEAFAALLSPRTRLVAITHMSNGLGTVLPAARIVRIAHDHGVPVLLDGCQAAVHLTVDVQALDVDFYVFSSHKVYGPTGAGVLYGKLDLLEAMPPYRGGGEMISVVTREGVTYADVPHRFEAGTPPIVEIIGMGAALTFLMGLDREAILAHEASLAAHARDRLSTVNSVRVLGPPDHATSIVSFVVEGAHPHDVSTIVDRSGVAIRAGHHCAQPLMARLDVTATARASIGMYNTIEEIDIFIDAVRQAQRLLAP